MPLTGEMKIELQHRRQHLQQFCLDLYKSPLTNYDAHVAYQTRYQPIAKYPYPATLFSSKELESIQKKDMSLLLPKLGINRNMPRDVIYGPHSLGGRHITNLSLEQPALNFKATIGHIRRKDKMAKILYVTKSNLHLELGVSKPFYTLPPDNYQYVTENTIWLYTWKITYEFKIQLCITQFWVASTKYENDKNIMKTAIRDPLY